MSSSSNIRAIRLGAVDELVDHNRSVPGTGAICVTSVESW